MANWLVSSHTIPCMTCLPTFGCFFMVNVGKYMVYMYPIGSWLLHKSAGKFEKSTKG